MWSPDVISGVKTRQPSPTFEPNFQVHSVAVCGITRGLRR
jgi:hypothetical protein